MRNFAFEIDSKIGQQDGTMRKCEIDWFSRKAIWYVYVCDHQKRITLHCLCFNGFHKFSSLVNNKKMCERSKRPMLYTARKYCNRTDTKNLWFLIDENKLAIFYVYVKKTFYPWHWDTPWKNPYVWLNWSKLNANLLFRYLTFDIRNANSIFNYFQTYISDWNSRDVRIEF